uniref:Myrosinase 1 n=1 Tax=Dendroctonus ponderosae TaxID=77166 RepID=A0AAR5QGS6_DENPD
FIVLQCFSSQADKQIPQDFLIGAGTSAFQIEGAWNEDGKGESIWDTFLHDKNAQEKGDIACDSYHKWEEDVANAKALGLDFYRFSIAWTRILPNGTLNNINQQGIDYYLNLIKALKAEGIEPMITIYHWDMPQHIYELGGPLNTQFVNYFGDFARLVYQNYAPYVKYWFTINEPTLVCNGGYGSGFMAPGLHLIGDGIYQCGYVLLKAHARAYRIYEEEFKPLYHGRFSSIARQVGLVINFDWAEAATDSSADLEAQERYIEFEVGWWANPIFLGNWPQIMIDRIADRSRLEGFARSRLPKFTEEEINYINGTHDFFALNT